jgi:hypothetical protein
MEDAPDIAAIFEDDFRRGRITAYANRAQSAADLVAGAEPEMWMLIEGVLSREAVTLLVGHRGTAKTFTALDWSLSVATGRPWLDECPIDCGTTALYVAGEGRQSFVPRLDAWRAAHGDLPDADEWQLLTVPGLLTNAEGWDVLHRVIRDRLRYKTPSLVVLDTLSSLFGARAEMPEHAPDVMADLARLRNRYDCAVVVVHHTPLSDSRRARGAIALEDNADDVLALVSVGDVMALEPTKRRDDTLDIPPIHVRVEPISGTASAVIRLAEGAVSWEERIVAALMALGPQPVPTAELRKRLGIPQRNASGSSQFKAALSALRKNKRVVGPRGHHRLIERS